MRFKDANVPLKAVLFDFDGTLIDSRKDIAAAANATRRHFGLSSLTEDEVESFVGNGVQVLLEKAMETTDPGFIQESLVYYKDFYREHCLDHTQVYPGVMELLEALRNHQVKMAVVSNKSQEFTEQILEKLSLSSFFQAALGPESTVNRKPNAEPLLTALRMIGAPTTGAVMIGDSVVDIQAGKAAGLPVGVVTQGYNSREALVTAQPDWMVDSLNEFIGILL
jgi:2-phosphoglycolate phosphatase